MKPHDFAKQFITRWEDGGSTDPRVTHSLDPVDNGNWTGGKQGAGVLVGSNHGVTPAALAAFRSVPVPSITRAIMAGVTLDEAAEIALASYYLAPRLHLLPWGRVTASVFDFGWGVGPVQAVKLLQRMLDVVDDGNLGPVTAKAFAVLLAAQGEEFVAGAWWTIRDAFYEQIIAVRSDNAKYERGWDNRSTYYTPGDASGWWRLFDRQSGQ